jgi:hypothetical protein
MFIRVCGKLELRPVKHETSQRIHFYPRSLPEPSDSQAHAAISGMLVTLINLNQRGKDEHLSDAVII